MAIREIKWRCLTAVLLTLSSAFLGGCQSWENFTKGPREETFEVTGPTPHRNETPMAGALACLRRSVPTATNYRIGVSEFVDGTGAVEGLAINSRVFSQRPDYMMIVGLKSAGVHLVNRSSVNVAEWEMKQAMEQKLGDGGKVHMDNSDVLFRPVQAGSILGSTHYITGAITELNWNISSNTAEGSAFGIAGGARTYRVSMAVDVMVTDTITTEVIHARSYKKQLIGYETEAGLFRFIERNQALAYTPYGALAYKALELFQANIGDKANEPNQTALRWVIELASYDVIRSLTKSGSECDSLLPPGSLDLDLPGGGIGPEPDVKKVSDKSGLPTQKSRRAEASQKANVKASAAVPVAGQAPVPVKSVGADPEKTVPPSVRATAESQYAAKLRDGAAATPVVPPPKPARAGPDQSPEGIFIATEAAPAPANPAPPAEPNAPEQAARPSPPPPPPAQAAEPSPPAPPDTAITLPQKVTSETDKRKVLKRADRSPPGDERFSAVLGGSPRDAEPSKEARKESANLGAP